MTVYLINILLIFFWGYILLYLKKSEKNTKIYCGIVAVQWIVLSGLRHFSVGDDTYAYFTAFERTKNISWSKIFSDIYNYLFNGLEIKDPGYELVEKIFQIFSGSYQLYLVFIAVVFTALMAVWVYKYSKMPCFSFILYSVLFYAFYSVTGHRQTLATALIVFWGYKYIREKKLIKFLILAFVAFLLHKSSVVFIPFYFIAHIPITTPYVFIAFVVIITLVFLGKSFYGVVAEFLGFSEDLIDYAVGGAETYALILTLLCVIILFFYFYYKKNTENATHIFNITLLTLMSSLLVFQNQSFMRIQQYYSLFLMISFPEVICSFDKKSRIIVYAISAGVLIFYLISNNPYYMFCWQ